MSKKLKRFNRRDFAALTDKISARWQQRTQHTTTLNANESTEAILRDLVAMPTVTGNYEANHEAFSRIDRFLAKRGMIVRRYEWNGMESLVATTRDTKTPAVCFFGHIDVVPAASELFQLKERDGKYYGRGVLDMKGGIAAFLGAIRELEDSLQDYDFGIILTSDEEVGGFDGAAKLVEEGYRPKMLICPDGGSNFNPERFAKGIWHITIEATGKSAHGSRPWEGQNAIENLMAVLHEIKLLFPEPSITTSTFNVGMLQGGEAINQIPALATASIDMRFSSAEEQMHIGRAVERIVEREGMKLTTEVESEPVYNDPENPYLRAFAECTAAVLSRKPEWTTSNASNDTRFFAKYGIPAAIAYPTGANHHGPEEYIEKEALLQMQAIYVQYLQRIARNSAQKPATVATSR